mgnify:FL=1|tara:strand:+ start:3247 stop:5631 length:2385 start_codon:yes stop_codon:yes gene_type:complete
MAVDKGINQNETIEVAKVGTEVQMSGPATDDRFLIEEDGSAVMNPEQVQEQVDFGSNLAEFMEDDELEMLSNELRSEYESDKTSREEWEMGYTKGLDLLGFKYEERSRPFDGASGVYHPLLSESVVQFQAQAYKEMLPAGGPVRTQLVGIRTPQSEAQADRVKEFMNYYITDVMEEYDPEMDQMLFHLPLAGSAFKKVYYDGALNRAVSKFVAAEDLVVPYMTSDLESAERVTHLVKMTENEIRKQQVSGFYRDVKINPYDEESDVQEKYNELEGTKKEESYQDYTLLEMHVLLDLDNFGDVNEKGEKTGIKIPYIVTIDEGSGKILSIYRNFGRGDPLKKKTQYFVHYKFLPGLGFYGFGLIHMLGGLTRTATASLRQLLDAGTLSNLPAGFKSRGFRIRDDDQPIQPGEFRDVDAPNGILRDSLLPLPYKEPSGTLFQLLGFCVDAGRRFAAIADMKMPEGGSEMPVGTTMALLERGTKVMSAIHKRLHNAQRAEFKLLSKIFASYLPPNYPYMTPNGDNFVKQLDFDGRVDVLPVSDPNIFSVSQRVTMAQMQLQLAQSKPEMHNLYEAYRRMYEALGVQQIETILPPPSQPMPEDPGVENSKALKGGQLQAFPQQNHDAHIEAHRSFMSSQLVRSQVAVLAILQGHVSEHVSLAARASIMQVVQQQIAQLSEQFGGQIPQQVQQQIMNEAESQVAQIVAVITNKMVQEETEGMSQQAQDPIIELKNKELDLRAAEIQRKAQESMMQFQMDQQKLDQDRTLAENKLQSQEDLTEYRQEMAIKRDQLKANRG